MGVEQLNGILTFIVIPDENFGDVFLQNSRRESLHIVLMRAVEHV